jgi:hypothetical protein
VGGSRLLVSALITRKTGLIAKNVFLKILER